MNYLSVSEECFADHPTGAARVAWDIVELVRDAGHDVTMICKAFGTSDTLARYSESVIDGIRVVRCVPPALSRWNPRRLESQIAAVEDVTRSLLARENWDVVHIHTPLVGAGVLRAIPAPGRTLYTMHSPVVAEQEVTWRSQGLLGLTKRLFAARMLGKLERRLLKQCAAIHTLSHFTKQAILETHGAVAPVTVIPHWVRSGWLRTTNQQEACRLLGWADDRQIVLTVRGLKPRNGVDVAIDAIAPLATGNLCRFVVAGDGYLRSSLEQRARTLGASSDQVAFLGSVSEHTLRLLYQAADLFVLPTIALECFGLIIQEAMAMGCPVVGTRVGAIPELLQPVAPDLLVEPGDASLLRAKVSAVLAGQTKLISGDELSTYVRSRFGEQAIGSQILGWLGLDGKQHPSLVARQTDKIAAPAASIVS